MGQTDLVGRLQLMDVKMTRETLVKIERGTQHIQLEQLKAIKKILDNVHNGEIMLLHPTSATNAKIMKRLITELKDQGYRFATLDEL